MAPRALSPKRGVHGVLSGTLQVQVVSLQPEELYLNGRHSWLTGVGIAAF